MAKVLYWNIKMKGKQLASAVSSLVTNHVIDILILSELVGDDTDIAPTIDEIERLTSMQFQGAKKDAWIYLWVKEGIHIEQIGVFNKLKGKDLVSRNQDDSPSFAKYLSREERMLFFKVKNGNLEYLLVPIHFPSRMHASLSKQKDMAVRFKEYIEMIENSSGLQSVVVGDFNMNPFDTGMVHHEGFHALSYRDDMENKTFLGKPYSKFYNPFWKSLGDHEIIDNVSVRKPAGSYYSPNTNEDVNYYWNTYDQVILREGLIPKFNFENYGHLTGFDSATQEFVKDNLRPNGKDFSDHLPLYFEIIEN